MRGRGSGTNQRVEAARRQARLALGKNPDEPDDYGRRSEPTEPTPLSPPTWSIGIDLAQAELVLSVGEAAARLQVSRHDLEAMIVGGKIESLASGFTKMIPTREVKRLLSTPRA